MPTYLDWKREAISWMDKVHGKGTDELLRFMDEKGYFTAPASSSPEHHSAFVGGLCYHSLLVCKFLVRQLQNYGKWSNKEEYYKSFEESAILIALVHDLCKIDNYKDSDEEPTKAQLGYLVGLAEKHKFKLTAPIKNQKKVASAYITWLKEGANGEPPAIPKNVYEFVETLPLGHSEKSIFLAQRFVQLSPEEALAIRFHMWPFDPKPEFPWDKMYNTACKMTPLVKLLQHADMEAYLYETYITPEQLSLKEEVKPKEEPKPIPAEAALQATLAAIADSNIE